MKPLTTEEKAKLYEEAIEQAKKELATCGDMNCDAARQIFRLFPELKESEDERIRKRIIHALHGDVLELSEIKEAITWLEKQGEQIFANIAKTCKDEQKPNPYSGASFDYNGHTWGMCARDNGVEILFDGELKAFLSLEKSFIYPIHSQPELAPKSAKEALFDYENANIQQKDFAPKIEPKFHKGEWVVSKLDRKARQISEVHCDEYNDYYIVEGDEYQIEEYDRLHHLWNIADAKPGDVLFHSDSASNGIFIFKELLKCGFSEEVICYCDYDSEDGFCLGDHHTCCWADAKILHPATKEQRDLLFQKMSDAGYAFDFDKKELKKIEQKSCMIQWTGNNLKEVVEFTGKSPNFDKWFKSQKEYEDYVRSHNNIFKLFNEDGSHCEIPVGAWIIKTPDGYNVASKFKFVPKPVEWSEEDQAHLESIDESLFMFESGRHENVVAGIEDDRNWLKSLKGRYTWKPSDEQMDALETAVSSLQSTTLESLYNELKKL